jgi:hypothetical protein
MGGYLPPSVPRARDARALPGPTWAGAELDTQEGGTTKTVYVVREQIAYAEEYREP